MEVLKLLQEDVAQLVDITQDVTYGRRERIEEIQWERKDPRLAEDRLALPAPEERRPRGYDRDERIYEREVIYEDVPRRGYR